MRLYNLRCLPLVLGLACGLIECYQVPGRGGDHKTFKPFPLASCLGKLQLEFNCPTIGFFGLTMSFTEGGTQVTLQPLPLASCLGSL